MAAPPESMYPFLDAMPMDAPPEAADPPSDVASPGFLERFSELRDHAIQLLPSPSFDPTESQMDELANAIRPNVSTSQRMNHPKCASCHTKFLPSWQSALDPANWGVTRRHHCNQMPHSRSCSHASCARVGKACGRSFCISCASKKIVLDVERQLEITCDSCYERLKPRRYQAGASADRSSTVLDLGLLEECKREARLKKSDVEQQAIVDQEARQLEQQAMQEDMHNKIRELQQQAHVAEAREHELASEARARAAAEAEVRDEEAAARAAATVAEFEARQALAAVELERAKADQVVISKDVEFKQRTEEFKRAFEEQQALAAAANEQKLQEQIAAAAAAQQQAAAAAQQAAMAERALQEQIVTAAAAEQQAAIAAEQQAATNAEIEEFKQRIEELKRTTEEQALAAATNECALQEQIAAAAEAEQQAATTADKQAEELRKAVGSTQELQSQLLEVTGGFDYKTHRRMKDAQAKLLEDELQDECEICMEEGGEHAPTCPKYAL